MRQANEFSNHEQKWLVSRIESEVAKMKAFESFYGLKPHITTENVKASFKKLARVGIRKEVVGDLEILFITAVSLFLGLESASHPTN